MNDKKLREIYNTLIELRVNSDEVAQDAYENGELNHARWERSVSQNAAELIKAMDIAYGFGE